jgi:hypothetical protein
MFIFSSVGAITIDAINWHDSIQGGSHEFRDRGKRGVEYHERNVPESVLAKLGPPPQKSEPSMWRPVQRTSS